MDVAVFSTKPYDREYLNGPEPGRHRLNFLEARLSAATAVLATGSTCVCAFVNDQIDAAVIGMFRDLGVRLIALRSAGYNNVDLQAAAHQDILVAHVPAYSPLAVAEHTVALILALNRNIPRAYNRVREGNFALDGMMGFNLHGRTVGIVGGGRIGLAVAGIMLGFGCRVLVYDPFPAADARPELHFVSLEDLLAQSDIVSLHCPLTPDTHYLINAGSIALMKPGVMLINTSRGGLVDTLAVTEGLKTGAIGYLGLDVYEEEANLFFENKSNQIIGDDVFERLLMFRNVLVTGHQGFFTQEALKTIAETTIGNITCFEETGKPLHAVT